MVFCGTVVFCGTYTCSTVLIIAVDRSYVNLFSALQKIFKDTVRHHMTHRPIYTSYTLYSRQLQFMYLPGLVITFRLECLITETLIVLPHIIYKIFVPDQHTCML